MGVYTQQCSPKTVGKYLEDGNPLVITVRALLSSIGAGWGEVLEIFLRYHREPPSVKCSHMTALLVFMMGKQICKRQESNFFFIFFTVFL